MRQEDVKTLRRRTTERLRLFSFLRRGEGEEEEIFPQRKEKALLGEVVSRVVVASCVNEREHDRGPGADESEGEDAQTPTSPRVEAPRSAPELASQKIIGKIRDAKEGEEEVAAPRPAALNQRGRDRGKRREDPDVASVEESRTLARPQEKGRREQFEPNKHVKVP